MNSRERVQRVLRGEPVDRMPRGEVALEEGFVRGLLGFRRRRAIIGPVEQRAAIAALDLDLVTVDATTGVQGLAQDVDKLMPRQVADWRTSDLAVVVRIDGPLNRLVKALGIEAAAARLDRGKTRPFGTLDMVSARMRGAVHRVAAAGATALLIADDSPDLALGRIPLEHLSRFCRPQLAASLHAARSVRLPVFIHIAPWHWPLLDELAKLGPAGLQGLAGKPLAEFRARLGPGMCLWGNAGSDWVAELHDGAEVQEAVRQLTAAGRPRHVFGSAAGLTSSANVVTVLEMYEALMLEAARPH